MAGAIVVILVESPPPPDPVGTVFRTLGSFELGAAGPIETDGSLCELVAGGPWEMGQWIDILHPALPETRRRHQISYVDTGRGFSVYRVNLRFEGDRNRVPVAVSEVAVEIAQKWIQVRSPVAVYITGRKGSPAEDTLADPKSLDELTWWSWVAGLPVGAGGHGVLRFYAGGVIIQLADEFHSKIDLPRSVTTALGLEHTPCVRVGL